MKLSKIGFQRGGGYRWFRIGPENGLALNLWLSITWSHAAQDPCFILLCAVGDNAIEMVGVISFFPALLSFRNSLYESVGMDCSAQHTSWQLTNSQFVGMQIHICKLDAKSIDVLGLLKHARGNSYKIVHSKHYLIKDIVWGYKTYNAFCIDVIIRFKHT